MIACDVICKEVGVGLIILIKICCKENMIYIISIGNSAALVVLESIEYH